MFEIFDRNFISLIDQLVIEAARHGASYYPQALKPSVWQGLADEVANDQFTTLTPDPSKTVVEDMEILKIPLGDDNHPLINIVGGRLRDLVQPAVKRLCLTQWKPNEAAAHRYHAGSQALGAHRDFSTDKVLIAVFTTGGSGDFELLNDDGSLHTRWESNPGGLCLMRAPGLNVDAVDDRPLHRALPPKSGTRQAVIYRQVQ